MCGERNWVSLQCHKLVTSHSWLISASPVFKVAQNDDARGSRSPRVAVRIAIKRGASVWLPRLHTEVFGVFERVCATHKSLEDVSRRKKRLVRSCFSAVSSNKTDQKHYFEGAPGGGVGRGELTNREFPRTDVILRLQHHIRHMKSSHTHTHDQIETIGRNVITWICMELWFGGKL